MASASTAASIGARDALQSVDRILEELDRLAATELPDGDFYAAVMARLKALDCSAAAFWILTTNGEPEIAWQSTEEARDDHSSDDAHHALPVPKSAVAAAIESGQPKLIEKSAEGNGSHASGGIRSIIAPWSPANLIPGAVQVWFANDVHAPAAGYLPVLAAVGELLAMYFARQEQRRLRQRLDQQSRIDAFNRSLHQSLATQQIAYRIANDGRVILDCDRLAVAIRRGHRYKIIAVSGADNVHARAESIEQLERLCCAVVTSGEALWHQATTDQASAEMAPQLSQPLAAYLDFSPAAGLAIVPLSPPPAGAAASPPLVVLVLEQYDRPLDTAARERLAEISEHCRMALANAEQVAAIPGHKLWLKIARPGWFARWTTRTAAAAIAFALLIAALLLIPADVRIKARGELQPAIRHDIFAPRDGVVTTIHVDHGQQVQDGQPLVEIRSPELELEMQRVAGELETARKRLAAAQSERLQLKPSDTEARLRQRRLTAEEEQYQQQVRDLADRQVMLQKELEGLTVRSPMAGEVISWNVQQQLTARPLRRGDALLTVADTAGPWQLELKVPSRRAGRLLATRSDKHRPVSFSLATDPGKTLAGTVTEIASRLEIDDSGESYLLTTVKVPEEAIDNRAPGATAFARIDCGRGTLAEAWFHDLIDAARLWMPF